MYLKCPNCGFSFGVFLGEGVTQEELEEIKTCPCGCMMEETEELESNVWEG